MKEKAKRAKEGFSIPLIQGLEGQGLENNEQGLEDKKEITLEIREEIKFHKKVSNKANKMFSDFYESKTSFCELISSLFSKLPAEIADWEKEWQKHLEEKYDG